jgi:hypothetical protein
MPRIGVPWGWFMASARVYACDQCGVSRSFSGAEPHFSHGTAPCACGAAPVAWVPVPDVRSWFVPVRRSEVDPLPNVVTFAGVECYTWADLWSAVGVQGQGQGRAA